MTIAIIPILAAAIANVLLGYVWFHPRVFGAEWMRVVNMTPQMAELGKKRMLPYTGVAFVGSLLIAYVMSYFAYAYGVSDWFSALELGFWAWAGFVAPVSLGTVLWEMRPLRFYAINAGYWLVSLCIMSLLLLI